MTYVWTLDSHMCIGTFEDELSAHLWAKEHGFSSYTLVTRPPFMYSTVHRPWR